jgi:hypothetical protein
VGIALVVAGCGSASPTTTSTDSQSPQSGVAAAFKFSRCMRSHGVSNFPDPVVNTGNGHQSIGIKVSPTETGSPQFNTAQKACQGILPMPSPSEIAQQQRTEEQGKLAFTQCIRKHGITGFPDPTPQGRLSPEMVSAAGVDLHAPAVIAAAEACASSSHGTITKAEIEQAVKGGQ